MFNFAPVKPIAALIVLLCGLLGFSLWTMVQETDRIDARRARVSVSAAIFGYAENLTKLVQKEVETAAGADALTQPQTFENVWADPSRDGRYYDIIFTLNADKTIGLAAERGKPSTIDYHAQFGDALRTLLRDLKARKLAASTGLAQSRRGLAIISVLDVSSHAATADTLAANRSGTPGVSHVVVAKYVTPDLLKGMGKDQWIYGLRMGQPRADEISTVLNDAAGDPVVTLSWRPVHPGYSALEGSALFLVAGVVLFLGVAAFLGRQGLEAVQELNSSAYTDSLSQLPNRRALHRDIDLAASSAPQIALAYLDLDGFKGVNDYYGHLVGDQLIHQCAATLVSISGAGARVYRLGGDEFAILVEGHDVKPDIEAIAAKILEQFTIPFKIEARSIVVGTSIGMSMAAANYLDAGELLRRADVAMYASKQAGKMRASWFDPAFDEKKTVLHKMELGLRAALEADHFNVVYQPLVNATGEKVVAVEALLRWTKPDGTMISPVEFIPVAEETGLINQIGLFVLSQACIDALPWSDVQLSVNVSAVQLRNPDFPQQLAEVLETAAFPAERLELEVTETYLVGEPETARRTLAAIHALGVKTALDDFGTGFASIGFLRNFAFDKLKIDRSLVCDAANNPASRALLQASVAMARALNMAVTAEGVENQAQADLARVAGCDQLQGWLYFRALSAQAITDQLAPPTRARQLFLPQANPAYFQQIAA